ncbi:hypothetical protein ACMWD3_05600 [Gardnerella swidsinskii]
MKHTSMSAFQPVACKRQKSSMVSVFTQDKRDVSGWVKTSVSLRDTTRRRLKQYALDHDQCLQEVVDAALDAYLR